MGRLIDADKLVKAVEKSLLNNPHEDARVKRNHQTEHRSFLYMISRQPTAFDVEAIVKKLKDKIAENQGSSIGNFFAGYREGLEDAIGIIDKGGVK